MARFGVVEVNVPTNVPGQIVTLATAASSAAWRSERAAWPSTIATSVSPAHVAYPGLVSVSVAVSAVSAGGAAESAAVEAESTAGREDSKLQPLSTIQNRARMETSHGKVISWRARTP